MSRRAWRVVWTVWVLSCLVWLAAAQDAPRMVEDTFDTSQSSWIEGAWYRSEVGAHVGSMVIQLDGEKVTYLDVPAETWMEFKRSESAGRFFTEHIKGKFERVQGDAARAPGAVPSGPPVSAQVVCAFNEDCEPLILEYIDGARETIRMAAYAFTRTRIAAALVSAKTRGVDVRVKMDDRQAEYPLAAKQIEYLGRNGIPVERIRTQGDYSAMHNKFLVIDSRYVIAGSYNYTTTAGAANWENVVWVDSPAIAAQYDAAWGQIRSE